MKNESIGYDFVIVWQIELKWSIIGHLKKINLTFKSFEPFEWKLFLTLYTSKIYLHIYLGDYSSSSIRHSKEQQCWKFLFMTLFIMLVCRWRWIAHLLEPPLLRPRVLLTQLVELDFRKLLDSTLTNVVIGYITRELFLTSFVKNNKFLTNIKSFLTKIASFLTNIKSIKMKMTFKTHYLMIKLII
jgi:hypothetical protein